MTGQVRSPVAASGTVPWRRRRGRLEVALVHRPRYDDWSWAKGKLDRGETWAGAAVRETHEETGLTVRLGRPLPTATYTLVGGSGHPAEKVVRYWAAEVVGGDGHLLNEIDEVAWLDVETAHDRLDYTRDRDQLRAVVRADQAGTLRTWPLAIIRHAEARARGSWKRDDRLRPLDARGRARARHLVPLLGAYGLTRVVSSPSLRCTQTVDPYAASAGLKVRLKTGLSEEGYAANPAKALHHLDRLLDRATPAAVCSHGPVLPDLLGALGDRLDRGSPDAGTLLKEAAADGMGKGEVVVAHLVGTGGEARVVAVERHEV